MKYCKKGDHKVSEESFNKSKKAKDGLQSYCRDCQKGVHQETWPDFYAANREKRIENTRQWKQKVKASSGQLMSTDLHHN